MDKKKIIGISIIVAAAVFLAALVYFLFFYNYSPKPETGEQAGENNSGNQAILNQEQQQDSLKKSTAIIENKQVNKNEIMKTELKMIAASFAERFGSFSNQSDYGNIRDLKIFMTASMQKWADDFISESRIKDSDSSIYHGFTAKAITQEIRQLDEEAGRAEILIKTQRKEAVGATGNTSTFYQDIIIKFIKEKGVWKVDEANWQ
ncbi:hypothetical protein KKC83_01305 [Patescibacteria group bacterium]|nr:hypothetical protein [Candidatus Falkowbacteria bacterium]MBU3906462.1 hypothetical protein [Patescibacteria group bacterium]MCG2698694.1 hypothetical protein [Candidatus Parcubacteria bacterium]MBU4015720.1 hypothetical protein [Patescibacteria group bacterium]MBU4026166.1 hypothetical protein [Patescibacteria group bacterium]